MASEQREYKTTFLGSYREMSHFQHNSCHRHEVMSSQCLIYAVQINLYDISIEFLYVKFTRIDRMALLSEKAKMKDKFDQLE